MLTRAVSLTAVLMSAAVLGGCGGDDEPSPVVTETVMQPAATPTPTASPTATPEDTADTGQLSREQAIAVVRRRYSGGKVAEVERDDEDGQAVWKIEIRTARGAKRKVSVAVDGGKIVKTEADNDRDDDGDD